MSLSISLDGVAVYPDCWCVCLCYLHFAPENPEDGVMYLLAPVIWVVPDKVQRAVKWLCVYLARFQDIIAYFPKFPGVT